MNATILVIEDEIKISEVIKSYLEKGKNKVYQAFDGEKGLELLKKENPNLVILDLMLPDISGEEVCKMIRKTSNVPIIMLTAKTQEHNILNGLNIGADDYITKPFSPRQLVARVNAFLRRADNFESRQISLNNGDLKIDLEKREIRKAGNNIFLTPIEYNILTTFVTGKKMVYTRAELIELALQNGFEGYDRVIDTHIKNLRHKIETNTKKPEYIITVFGVGYKFGGQNDL